MNIFLTAAKEIVLKKEEKRLIEIIRDVLAGKNKSEWSMQIFKKRKIERVIKCARVHGVLPFCRNVLYLWRNRIGKNCFLLKDYAYEDAQQAYAAETFV